MINRQTLVTNYTANAYETRARQIDDIANNLSNSFLNIAETAKQIEEASINADYGKIDNDPEIYKYHKELELLNQSGITNVDEYKEKYGLIMNDWQEAIRNKTGISKKAKDRYLKDFDAKVKPRYDKGAVEYEVILNYQNTIKSITDTVGNDIENSATPLLSLDSESEEHTFIDFSKAHEQIQNYIDTSVEKTYGKRVADSVVINKGAIVDAGLQSYLFSGVADLLIENERADNPKSINMRELIGENIKRLDEERVKNGLNPFSESEQKSIEQNALKFYEARKAEYEQKANEMLIAISENVLAKSKSEVIDLNKELKPFFDLAPNKRDALHASATLRGQIKTSNNEHYARDYFKGDNEAFEKIEDNEILKHQIKEINKYVENKYPNASEKAKLGLKQNYLNEVNANGYLDDNTTSATAVYNILALDTIGLDKNTYDAYVRRMRLDGISISDNIANNLWKVLKDDVGGEFAIQKQNIFSTFEKKDKKGKAVYPDFLTEDTFVDLWVKAYSEIIATGKGKNQQETLKLVNEKVKGELTKLSKAEEIKYYFETKSEDNYFYADPENSKAQNIEQAKELTNISHIDSGVVESILQKTQNGENTYKTKLNKDTLANDIAKEFYGKEYKSLSDYQKNIVCDNALFVARCIKQDELIANSSDYYVVGSMVNPRNNHICHLVRKPDTSDIDNETEWAEVLELIKYSVKDTKDNERVYNGAVITKYRYKENGEIDFDRKGESRREKLRVNNKELAEINEKIQKEVKLYGYSNKEKYENDKKEFGTKIKSVDELYEERQKLFESVEDDE